MSGAPWGNWPGAWPWDGMTPATQAHTHWALIWEPHLADYPGGRLSVSYPSGRPGQPHHRTGVIGRPALHSDHVMLDDWDAIWETVSRRQAPPTRPGAPGGDAWVGVAPRRAGLERWQRGGGRDTYPLSALYVDLDVEVAGAVHKNVGLPTPQQAKTMIMECPVPPHLIVWTGGGFHLWWALAPGNRLDPGFATTREDRLRGMPGVLTDAQRRDADLISRFKGWWASRSAADGVHIDLAVIGDRTRVLRLAGSRTGKYGTVCQILALDTNPRHRLTKDQLDLSLPPLPAATVRGREARAARHGEVRVAVQSGFARPGDRLSAEVRTSDVLIALGMEEVGARGWWSPSGGEAHDTHGRLYIDGDAAGETETITVFDRTLRTMWGLDDSGHALDAWGVLGYAVCHGDWTLAGQLARRFAADWEALLTLLGEGPDVAALRSLTRRRPRCRGVAPEDIFEIVAAHTDTWAGS